MLARAYHYASLYYCNYLLEIYCLCLVAYTVMKYEHIFIIIHVNVIDVLEYNKPFCRYYVYIFESDNNDGILPRQH